MDLRSRVGSYKNFPKKGITFRDFGPMLDDPSSMSVIADEFQKHYHPNDVDLFAGVESRGFIIACMLAVRYGKGMVMIRKPGKLPGGVVKARYATEYSTDSLEVQKGAFGGGRRVVICDDLLATGGTAKASADLVERVGGKVAGFAFAIELADLGGAEKISKYKKRSLVTY